MASGFLSGLVAGAAVSTVALGAASVLTGGAEGRLPETAAVEVPAGSEFNQSLVDGPAQMPQADGAPALSGEAPQVDAAAPDDLSAIGAGGTQPSQRPQPGSIDADLSAPQVPTGGSGITPSQPDGASIAAPDMQADPALDRAQEAQGAESAGISTDPAQPSVPEVETGAGLVSDMDQGSAAEMAEPGSDMLEPDMPAPELRDPDTTDPEPAAPEIASALPQPEMDADDTRSSTIGDIATNIETGRLPSVGAEPEGTSGDAPVDEPVDTRAIIRNAAPFDNSEGKPLMSIVLIDDGSSPIGLEALDAFPYPLSFAVEATAPGASERMERYRNAGFEVLAIADLPEGADARDTETVMQTVLAAVPDAVGILEGTGTGLQISRDASEQLAPILLESGHGLVLFAKGLGTAPKLIAREGVPVGTVFRDFDSNDQSPTVIRRFLDQAAFKAGREEEGGVIMLGRLRADTISALLLWGLQDRASSVALAPVSAVLLDGS
ncbi:divergent polysaccharide deacteylase family protein [Roseovarius nanhaiticus]|uniref:divergent polysaccharide deacteylase family protein n=1 Tax=Roseovarius nanhaiticus TaxID=573024 RepID=UPI002490753C|nr:divergent polysaccharide deacteylase family protein [Roseovarius nanhaiticus]